MNRNCSIFGLGKLGACMAAAIASKRLTVIGVDKDKDKIDCVNQGRAPIFEPHLDKLIRKYRHSISATQDYKKAVLDSDISFIVVPTPSNSNGEFSLSFVNQATKEIGEALASKKSYHIVVLTSTVLPKATGFRVKPILEKYSGKKCGKDFGLCYNPEFIALGTVIRNFLNPDFILIGESDKRAGDLLKAFYQKVCDNNPPFARMNFVNAELTKISVNSFITTKITFANMLTEIAQQLPGGNVDVVTSALGLDSRIGKRYLKGGLGYGGPCFPRDNAALASVARKLKVKADIPESTDKFNRRIVQKLYKLICSKSKGNGTIGIMGLSYKPLSGVIEESQGFLLASKLIQAKRKIVLYDQLCIDTLKKIFSDKGRVIYAESPKDIINLSDILVIANPDSAFLKLKTKDFSRRKWPLILIDCWRLLQGYGLSNLPNLKYIPFGIGE